MVTNSGDRKAAMMATVMAAPPDLCHAEREGGPRMTQNGFVARAASMVALVTLAACATGPAPPLGPPSVARLSALPAPPQARYYADCIAASAAAGDYLREPDADVLRFTCSGPTARAFYDGLAVWSASQDSQIVADGRTWRFTQKLIRDPQGIDGCSTGGPNDYRCVVVLNIGEFLSE